MLRPALHLSLLALGAGLSTGCLDAWKTDAWYACSGPNQDQCPSGFTCDDRVCCKPGSERGCPTLPFNNRCADGGAPVDFSEDRDRDNEGNPNVISKRCALPVTGGWVPRNDDLADCNDSDPTVNTRTPEVCNGKNDNCDSAGLIDEGLQPRVTYFLDQDGDGFGDDAEAVLACAAPPGTVAQGGDCGPYEPGRYPGAPEQCNGVDDNCDRLDDFGETRFVDTGAIPCFSGGQGVCQAGTFSCDKRADGGVSRVCQGTTAPEPFDRCDGLDNDCDGQVDEAPDCGGPLSLTQPGLVRGARYSANLTVTQQTGGCLKDVMGPSPQWNDSTRVWSDNGESYNLWFVEAPGATVWDLSRQNLRLRLSFSIGTGSSPTAFENADTFRHPVIYLCGEGGAELIRYVPGKPDAGGVSLEGRPGGFDQTVLLSADTPRWFTGRGSGFDTARVKRVEVLLYSNSAPWSVTIAPESGFVP